MTEKEKREEYMRNSDARVAGWTEGRQEAFYRAVDREKGYKEVEQTMNNAEIAKKNANEYLQQNKEKLYYGIVNMITALSKQGRRQVELRAECQVNHINLAPYFNYIDSSSMIRRMTPELHEVILKLRKDGFMVWEELSDNTPRIRILW